MKKIILFALTAIYKKVVGRTLFNGNTYYWGRGGCCILALAALMMVGCDYNSNKNINTKTEGGLYGTIIIDSCEYIRGDRKLAHKGNCRFCEERYSIKWEKRRKELVEQLRER